MSVCEWVWGHFMEHGKHAKSYTHKMNDSLSSNNYQYLLRTERYLEIICPSTLGFWLLDLVEVCEDNHSCSKVMIFMPCHVHNTAPCNTLPCNIRSAFSFLLLLETCW